MTGHHADRRFGCARGSEHSAWRSSQKASSSRHLGTSADDTVASTGHGLGHPVRRAAASRRGGYVVEPAAAFGSLGLAVELLSARDPRRVRTGLGTAAIGQSSHEELVGRSARESSKVPGVRNDGAASSPKLSSESGGDRAGACLLVWAAEFCEGGRAPFEGAAVAGGDGGGALDDGRRDRIVTGGVAA